MYYKGVSNKRDRAQALVSIHERLPHWTENKKDHIYVEMYTKGLSLKRRRKCTKSYDRFTNN